MAEQDDRESLQFKTPKRFNLRWRLRHVSVDTGQKIQDWVADALDAALKAKGR